MRRHIPGRVPLYAAACLIVLAPASSNFATTGQGLSKDAIALNVMDQAVSRTVISTGVEAVGQGS